MIYNSNNILIIIKKINNEVNICCCYWFGPLWSRPSIPALCYSTCLPNNRLANQPIKNGSHSFRVNHLLLADCTICFCGFTELFEMNMSNQYTRPFHVQSWCLRKLLANFTKMTRVVPDQKTKFENDELFRKLSRESEVGHLLFQLCTSYL